LKILPAATETWSSKIARRHEPQPVDGLYGYRKYRPCLRWEFGFSCAFCLCHEVDLALHGRTEIEHFIPVSHDPEQKNVYSNCFLICPLCNRSRGAAPNHDPLGEGHLLNPCEVIWQEIFRLEGNDLLPGEGNADAAYTWETYDLNDPQKAKMREMRRETIDAFTAFENRFPELQARLLAQAQDKSDPERLDVAKELWDVLEPVKKSLALFQAIPRNADQSCQCGHTGHHSLPDVLDRQTLEFDL
jgi:hypothetical protein